MEKMAGKLQRPVSLFLAAVMVLSTLYPVAAAESSLVKPTQASTIDMPTVQIEGSVIQNQFGQFTGFFELALRVSTPNNKMFRDLMVSLVYDSSMLTPVSWEAVPDENGAVTPLALGEGEYSTQQSAKKADGIATAVALTQAATEGSNSNLLYFHAESMKGVSLPDRTTLAVVRFKMADAAIQKFSLQDKGDGTTQLLYDGIAADAAAMTAHFVHFSPDEAAVDSPAGQSLYYYSGDNQFYYTPVTARETVTEKVLLTGNSTATDVPYTAPKTLGKKVLAVDEAKAGTAEYYSYLSNLLPEGNVSFSLTTGESYAKTGLELDKLCVITYMDWDDTILGTQIVPQNADVRKLVNDYVKDNFIYPELQNNTNYTSTARADSYRGKYPYSGPSGSATEERADGTDFPLTNKLEYTFLKKGMEKNTSNPAAPIWKQTGIDTAYPFIHGWAIVPSEGECWTTLGVGELAGYNAAAGTLPITAANLYFQPADFVDIQDHAITVKAIYEPGEKLRPVTNYTIPAAPEIFRYGYTASTENATYAIKYQYERIATDGYGVGRAREPVVMQGFTMDALETDGKNEKSMPVYMEVKVENKDVIDVLLTPAGQVWQINYSLVDAYGTNFVLAMVRSLAGNSMNVPDNFNYSKFKYSTRQGTEGLVMQATLNTILAEAHKEALGLPNELVDHFKATTTRDLNLKRDGDGNDFLAAFLSAGRTKIVSAVRAAGDDYASLTWHQLQYHIIHSDNTGAGGIILPGGGVMTDEACKMAEHYKWCRLLDGCVEGSIITVESLRDILTVVHDNNVASINLMELGQVNSSPLWFRADESGKTFTDLTDFINQMKEIVNNAGPDYITLTWQQVQYALLHGNSVPTEEIAKTESATKYYWRDGLTKVTDWPSFLRAANGAAGGNPAALNLLTLDSINNDPLYLRIDKDGTAFTADDLEAFRTKVRSLVSLAGENWAGITWEQAQHYLIHGGVTLPDQNTARTEADAQYWWAGGGQKPTDLPSLLRAAQLANSGKPAALNGLTAMTDLSDAAQYLRSNFKGDPFENVPAFISAIRAVAGSNGVNLTWEQVQYYLIHGGSNVSPTTALLESNKFYWWKGDGTGSSVILSANDITTFVEAAYRATVNGNIHAWDNLSTAMIEASFLRKSPVEDSMITRDMLNRYASGDLESFKILMGNLVVEGSTAAPYAIPALTWYQVQHYLLTSVYLETNVPDETVYWWKEKQNKPGSAADKTKMDFLLDDMTLHGNGAIDEVTFKNLFPSNTRLNDLGFSSTADKYTAYTPLAANTAKTRLAALARLAYNSGTGRVLLTWCQVQHYLLTQTLVSAEDAASRGYGWIPEELKDKGRMMRFFVPSAAETQSGTEVITSPDGLTTTATETVVSQDGETGSITIVTTVTSVTASVTLAGNETITTTVTTKTVTTTVISADGKSVTTTDVASDTKVDRLPLEEETEKPNGEAPEIEGPEPTLLIETEATQETGGPPDAGAPVELSELSSSEETKQTSNANAENQTPPVVEISEPTSSAETDQAGVNVGTAVPPSAIVGVGAKVTLPLAASSQRNGLVARWVQGHLFSPQSPGLLLRRALFQAVSSQGIGERTGTPQLLPTWGTVLSIAPWVYHERAFPIPAGFAYLGGKTI